MADIVDARLRYPFQSNPALPENQQEYLSREIVQHYGDSMRQIIAMPIGYSADHPGAHLQLVAPRAYVKTKASLVAQPFHTTALHRLFTNGLTKSAISEKIIPAICDRLNEFEQRKQAPVTIESHFDMRTHADCAHWEPDPQNMSIRFVSANIDTTRPPMFLIHVECRPPKPLGEELHKIGETMTAAEFAKDPRVRWSAELQKRTIGRLLDTCVSEVEKYAGKKLAERVDDTLAKVSPHERMPKLALCNGPVNVSNMIRYIEPKFRVGSSPSDPRTQGMVGFYVNCVGEASKGVLLSGNHNDPLYELHGAPEIDTLVGSADGSKKIYRSPVLIQNSVFNALPGFQPRLTSEEQKKIVNAYKQYPSKQEAIQQSIVSLSGPKNVSELAPHFSRFRTPTEAELKTVTCDMSKRAFGLSGSYQRYDPIVSIVP
jgi:hypothetical protein